MSTLLDQLATRRQFILYRLVSRPDGKTDKIPTAPLTSENANAQDPKQWMLPTEASFWAAQWNATPATWPPGVIAYGVGLVIFEGCGIAALDFDNCREANGGWMPHVVNFEARFPGAYCETSVSKTGRHVFVSYTGAAPIHGTRNATYRAEAYTKLRFVAITGDEATGSVSVDHTAALTAFLAEFFPARVEAEGDVEWTDGPCANSNPIADDSELVQRALRIASPRAIFGGRASFADLWNANLDVLARAFPSPSNDAFDRSSADMALASHLAWLTGNDCTRIERLMRESKLNRSKYDRPDYMHSTILRACSTQTEWYVGRDPTVPKPPSDTTGVPLPPTVPAPPTATVPTEGVEHRPTFNTRNQYEATLENIVHVLGEQQRTRIGFDTFRGRIMIAPAGTEDWRPMSDTDMIQLREWLGRVGRFAAIPKELMRDALQLVAERYKFDSAITWLNGLAWDGVKRVQQFLTVYCGTPDDDYARAVSEYIWSGLAARVLDPGCQLDMVVALQSKQQGLYKSTALQALVPDAELFTDGLELHNDDDNFKRLLRGKLVVEIAELAGLSRADVTLVKRVITRRIEEWIEKWQVHATRFARRCMFFATTNEEQFLPKDDTGQRRWLPVEIVRIDRERVVADRPQLWAEGAVMHRNLRAHGLPGVLYAEAERLALGRHAKHEQTDVWEPAIERWLSKDPETRDGQPPVPPPSMRPFTISEVLSGALGMFQDRMDQKAEARAGRVLRQLGYDKRNVRLDGKVRSRWVRVGV